MEVKVNSLKAWLLASRPKTLAAAVAPGMVGSSLAFHYGAFKLIPALACLFFAMLMQIAANLINDLFDYLKGTDGEDRKGPQRATAQGWITPSAMKKGICIVVASACLVGSTLIYYAGWQMILVGLLCAAFAYSYTSGPYPLSYHGLGDLAVVVFFGMVAVGFTCYVQWLDWSFFVLLTGVMTGLVINTLLVLNNYRDRDTDWKSGKMTLVVIFGEPFGRYFYLISGWLAAVCVFPYVSFESKYDFFYLPALSALLYSLLHFLTWLEMSAIREGECLNDLIGKTSRNMLVFAVMLSLSLCTSL